MATFSKRHYEALAGAIRKARELNASGEEARTMLRPDIQRAGIIAVEAEISAMLAGDNPAFDGDRFAIASGMRGTK